jgi:hypothetical protein
MRNSLRLHKTILITIRNYIQSRVLQTTRENTDVIIPFLSISSGFEQRINIMLGENSLISYVAELSPKTLTTIGSFYS